MSAETLALQAGIQVSYEGRPCVVFAVDARTVTLKGLADSNFERVDLAEFLTSSGLAAISDHGESPLARNALIERVPEKHLALAHWRLRHLNEATTGYAGGSEANALPGEPRPAYDPHATTLHQRFQAKVSEMATERPAGRVSVRTLYRWHSQVFGQQLGLLGVCDQRFHKLSDPFAGVAPEVLEVLDAILEELVGSSTKTGSKVWFELQRRVEKRYGNSVKLPGRTRFYEVLKVRTRQTSAFGEARAREGARKRPQPSPFPLRATRSGEVLQIDSTVADLLCIDRRTGRLCRPEITVAIDGYDKSLRAVRVVPSGTRGVDAAFVLYDALMPQCCQSGWSDEAGWNYAGIPKAVAIRAASGSLHAANPAAKPFGTPLVVICDHGKIFLSHSFFAACHEFGISVLPAPPDRPHYKGVVEQFFDTKNEWLWQHLPGHTGRNAAMRGGKADANAVVFLDELHDLIVEWAICVYHKRPHDGCRLPEAPQVKVSPDTMFEQSVAQNGFLNVAPHPDQLVRLLPVAWRKINHYGINLDWLKYYAPILDDWMHEESPYGKGNRYPFHADPRDLSRIWFQDPREKEWHALKRRGARYPDLPFSDAGLAWTKRLILEAGLDPTDPHVVNDHLDRFLERTLTGRGRTAAEEAVIEKMTAAGERSQTDLTHVKGVPTEAVGKADVPRLVALSEDNGSGTFMVEPGGRRLKAVPSTDDGPSRVESDLYDRHADDDDSWDAAPLPRID